MNRKEYPAPVMEIFYIEPTAVICESNFGSGTEDFSIIDDFNPEWD